jgi:PKD repeat protein
MKKYFFAFSLILLVAQLPGEQIVITTPGQIFVGSEVHFRFEADLQPGASLRWDFGDGSSESRPGKESQHVFKEPGNFHVTCTPEGPSSGPASGEVTVNVGDNRRITPEGANFRQGTKVNFRADNFVSNGLRWDFGDGTVEPGPKNHGHVYANPGNFTVKAFDFNGDTPTAITCPVAIAADNRQLAVVPAAPRAGQGVAFSAQNFSGAGLRWDFGDGTVENGGASMSHSFRQAGNYQVLVWEEGDAQHSALKTSLTVQPDARQVSIVGPADIFEGAEVVFESRNFAAAALQWDFGDGTVEPGGARQAHRFPRPGSFQVKVVEAGSDNLPLEKKVQVLNDDRLLQLKTGVVFAGSEFEIEARNFRGGTISWDFGDGQLQSGPRLMKHRYARAGQFRVRAVDFAGRDGKALEKNIVVENDTRLIRLPGEVIAGEAVALQLQNAGPGDYAWRFSDGESRRGGLELRDKVFRSPGTQRLTVADAAGKYPPLERTLQVLPDNRVLKGSAGFILPNEEVSFTALNFRGPAVRWDFGDGSVKESGQLAERHAYSALGRYQVKAVDFNGGSSKVFSADVVVAEMTPGFEVSALELAFDNGKYYRVIAKNSPGPGYQLRVKARGRGVLSGQFILDNMSVGLFQLVVQENQAASLPKAQMPALPVTDLGLHELTLKFSNYSFNRQIPIIKYFVSAAGMIQIVAPLIDARVPAGKTVELRWAIERKKPRFEIAISEIPFQFLDDKQVAWRPLGEESSFPFAPGARQPGSWIYWQVRLLNENGQVQTTSEVASFKLSE